MSVSYLLDKRELTFIAALVCGDAAELPEELAAFVEEGETEQLLHSLEKKGLAIMRNKTPCIEQTLCFLIEQMCTAENVQYRSDIMMYIFRCEKLVIAAGTDRLNKRRCRMIPFKNIGELEDFYAEKDE